MHNFNDRILLKRVIQVVSKCLVALFCKNNLKLGVIKCLIILLRLIIKLRNIKNGAMLYKNLPINYNNYYNYFPIIIIF